LRVRATVQVLPLLLGRFGFDKIELVGPQIDVAVTGPSESFADWLASPPGQAAIASYRVHGQSLFLPSVVTQ
jgi:ABC-type tungstate transport system permease subunit